MKKLAKIGITLDFETKQTYSKYPWYALRKNYCDAVHHSGGLPLPLPYFPENVNQYMSELDGIVVTGGDFDVDPSLFGSTTRHPKVSTKENRTLFEKLMIEKALEQNKPVLGICGGQQLLNVVLGGTLIQHIPDEINNPLPHEQPNPRHEPGHQAKIIKDSFLYDIVGEENISVNSAHHQAVKDLAPHVKLNAIAPDNVIEGFEAPDYSFCLGIQWHPEFHISPADKKIFDAFINHC